MANHSYLRFLTAAAVLLAVWLSGKYILPLIFPFLLGGGLALLAEPIVNTLHLRFHLPRGVATGIGVGITFGLLALAVLLTGAMLVRELGVLAGVVPDHLGSMVKTGISALRDYLLGIALKMPGTLSLFFTERIRELFSGGTALLDRITGYVLSLAGGVLSQVPDGALSFGTGLISSFMISAKLPALRQRIGAWRTHPRLQPVFSVLRKLRTALGGWLLAQVKLSGITWGILTAGFLLLRIPLGPIWAFLTALVDAFPVLGTGTVLVPWSLICLLQGNAGQAVGLLGIYGVVSLLRSVLEPKILGQQLGVDPLVTLAALYAGYRLWGLAGLIAAPMIAVLATQLIPGTHDSGS